MKVLIQRYGIVIKSIDVTGDRARIGNAADSEIMIDDPYLSSHVADLVKRDGVWRIVDSGTSLEGVTRGGARVEDEPAVAGTPYGVGGFELVLEDAGMASAAAPAAAAAPRTAAGDVAIGRTVMEELPATPRTMMETDADRSVPRTMFETPVPSAAPPQPAAAPRPVVMAAPAAPVAAQPARSPNRLRLVLLFLVLAIGFMFVLIIAGSGRKKPAPVAKKEPVSTPVTTTATAAAPIAAPAGDTLIGRLDVDGALNAWEGDLKRSPDPALRDRFCSIASEVASVYAASGNNDKARSYYSRVAAIGDPESDVVKAAKAKL